MIKYLIFIAVYYYFVIHVHVQASGWLYLSCPFYFVWLHIVLLTFSPSLIAFSRSPSSSKSRSSVHGECFSSSIALLPVASFYWPFVLLLLDFQRRVTITAPAAGCRSVWWKAWCCSRFGCNSCQLWIFFSFPFSFQHVIFCLQDPTQKQWFVPSQMSPQIFC